MLVYVVTMWDPYQDHFMGVFSSVNAAKRYCAQKHKEDGEKYTISEELVQS